MLKVYCQNVWNYNPSEYRNGLLWELVKESEAEICLFQEFGPATIRVGRNPLPSLLREEFTEACPQVADRNYTPVYYKSDVFSEVDSGYFLYEGKNDCNSKSITWAVLEKKATGQRIAVLSTHFWWMFHAADDNQQRLRNVEQLQELCGKILAKYDVPMIVGGDLNNGKFAEQGDEPYRYMLEKGFSDVRETAKVSTDLLTHHDYPKLEENGIYSKGPMPVRVLDYLFTYGKNEIPAEKFEILTTEKALTSSDHCPLVGEFEF